MHKPTARNLLVWMVFVRDRGSPRHQGSAQRLSQSSMTRAFRLPTDTTIAARKGDLRSHQP